LTKPTKMDGPISNRKAQLRDKLLRGGGMM
jgi:hypothetical protein